MTAAQRAMLWMLLFGGIWATVEIVAAFMHRAYSPYQIVWGRYGVHLAFMLALFGRREPGALIRTQRPGFQLARSMLMLIMPASFIMALQRGVDYRVATAVLASVPVLILIFGTAFLRERPANGTWTVAILVAAACAACEWPLPGFSIRQLVFPLVTAVSFSLYVVMTRSLRTETTRANLFYSALGVFAVLSVFIARVWIRPDAHDLACIVIIGLLGYLGLYAIDRCTAFTPVSVSAPFAVCQIPISLAFATVMSGVRP
jgi:drug/metabolite transporter (DMT)-like permease